MFDVYSKKGKLKITFYDVCVSRLPILLTQSLKGIKLFSLQAAGRIYANR